MANFPNFADSAAEFEALRDLPGYYIISQQRQTTGNRSNDSDTANSLVSSTNLTSPTSHNFYPSMQSNMLPTPEAPDNNSVCSEALLTLSPYNMIPTSGPLTIDDTYKEGDFYFGLESPEFIPNYNIAAGILSPQNSPTLPPDASMNNSPNSPTRRQSHKGRYSPITKQQKISSNNNDSMSQTRKKSSFTSHTNGNNNINNNNGIGNNNVNNVTTTLPSIITGSPNKLHSDSIMLSLLELTSSPMVATSTAPEAMPNLNLGSNLVSDVTNTHPSSILSNEPSSSSFSDKIDPMTPSSIMKIQNKSPKSSQNEPKSNSQQQQQQSQQKKQDQTQQLQPISKEHSFIAPTPPSQLNQIRTNIITDTGVASPSSISGRKQIRSNLSPLALGPTKSPQSLKPTISPNLKPKLPGVLANEVAEQLANKSNYRSILEGTAKSLGISYSSEVHSSLESRRTTHKAAEQKRRDSLKHSFDELKKVVPFGDGTTNNNNKSNVNGKPADANSKNVSKLLLLKRAHEHIVELEQKSKEKDELIQKLKDELDDLKKVKRQKVEETKKKENEENKVDMQTKQKDEQQTSSNDC